ncbi:unnamed protein product, partial [Polarella glacialis]
AAPNAQPAAVSSRDGHRSSERQVSSGRLKVFRTRYPMDDRAFDYLEQADASFQETVLTEFAPKREGEADYSAAVTSFIKAVKNRADGAPRSDRKAGRGEGWLLEGFRRRYPMDDRAFEFVQGCSAAVQKDVVERFRPRTEGEADYSRLVTSFVRQCKS